MEEDKEKIWEVEEIDNSKSIKGVVQYRVQWTGCMGLENTWETLDQVDNGGKKLQEFQQNLPKKS